VWTVAFTLLSVIVSPVHYKRIYVSTSYDNIFMPMTDNRTLCCGCHITEPLQTPGEDPFLTCLLLFPLSFPFLFPSSLHFLSRPSFPSLPIREFQLEGLDSTMSSPRFCYVIWHQKKAIRGLTVILFISIVDTVKQLQPISV